MLSRRCLAPRGLSAVRCLSTAPIGHSGHLSAAALRNQHDVPVADAGLTHKQKYCFDLNGFLVIRNAFESDMVSRANAAVDAHISSELHERKAQLRTSGLYGRESKVRLLLPR